MTARVARSAISNPDSFAFCRPDSRSCEVIDSSMKGHIMFNKFTLCCRRPDGKRLRKARVPLLIEQRAIDLIKATSAKLAGAGSMGFTAIVDIEYPSKLGPPLAYPVRYDVAMQRPDKLRVLQSGAGAPNEFYYDGKTMMAFLPEANLVAIADAPPTWKRRSSRRTTRRRSTIPSPTCSCPTPTRRLPTRCCMPSTSARPARWAACPPRPWPGPPTTSSSRCGLAPETSCRAAFARCLPTTRSSCATTCN
jgi:hypothetical protein